MAGQLSSYLSSTCESRVKDDGQNGIFSLQSIKKGELIAVFGGVIYDWDGLSALPDGLRSLSLQVEDELFLVPETVGEGDYVNHSCNPNAGLSGQICLVAMRAIKTGEEIRFDYAMCDSLPYDEFDCGCGAKNCRGRITGDDWKLSELQERYAGYFSPYLQRRIEAKTARQAGKAHYERAPLYVAARRP